MQSTPDQPGAVPGGAGGPVPAPVVFRWALAMTGVFFVGLGAVGVLVPGFPTTVFLIAACWCFARSCPWLEDRLVRNRFFGPFLRYLQPGAVMPMRARLITMAVIMVSVGISTAFLISKQAAAWIPWVVVGCGLIGMISVWFVARPKR